MPAKSPAQKRLMEAAAHTKGGYGRVPQKVGKEFVGADNQPGLATVPNTGIGLTIRSTHRPVAAGKKAKKLLASDSVCAGCAGQGCDKCGGSGVAPLTHAPMKTRLGADSLKAMMRGLGTLARDEWNEGEHPRKDDGKFGSGSGGKSTGTTGAGGTKSSSRQASSSKSTGSGSSSLKMSDLKQTGGKMGSNEGGTYEDAKGGKFYVKKPGTSAHVRNERMAAKLYQLAGAKTLDYRDVEGGQHVATELKKLEKKNISEFTPAERKEAAKDFAIHAWLSNWDAAGTGGDNQGVLEGKTTTLDVGGALRFRAQGGPKGDAFGDKVVEWDTMRDKGMSPDAAKLFAPMSEAELKASVERVSSIPDAKIREAVGGDDALADRLIARKKDLASKAGLAMDWLHPMVWHYNAGPVREVELAFDRAMIMGLHRDGLAFDRAPETVRSVDADGRMHVEVSNISKATVNPYLGKEIPKWKDLGLNPDRIYKLLRDPAELKKAAPTFNNLQLLDIHKGISAANHLPEHVMGSTGTDAVYEHPHLKNSLVIWAEKGIRMVENEKKKELSCAYRYRADMTPGMYEGVAYDGVMRDIVGNHVALVEEGRAGSDVVVGDSALNLTKGKFVMSKKVLLSRMGTVAYGALMTYLQPQLAMDAKIDLVKPLRGLTGKNFKAQRPKLATSILSLVTPHLDEPELAADGSIKAGLDAVLDMIEGMPKAEDEFPDAKKDDKAEDEMSDEDADMESAEDDAETDEEKAARMKKRADDKKAKDKKAKDMKPKAGAKDKKAKDADVNEEDEEHDPDRAKDEDTDTAMDTNEIVELAIAKERKRAEAVSAAKEHVRARVGALNGMAFDSAASVYSAALKMITKKDPPKKADAETLKYAFDSLPAAAKEGQRQLYAMDSASSSGSSAVTDITKRQPELAKNLARIGRA